MVYRVMVLVQKEMADRRRKVGEGLSVMKSMGLWCQAPRKISGSMKFRYLANAHLNFIDMLILDRKRHITDMNEKNFNSSLEMFGEI